MFQFWLTSRIHFYFFIYYKIMQNTEIQNNYFILDELRSRHLMMALDEG